MALVSTTRQVLTSNCLLMGDYKTDLRCRDQFHRECNRDLALTDEVLSRVLAVTKHGGFAQQRAGHCLQPMVVRPSDSVREVESRRPASKHLTKVPKRRLCSTGRFAHWGQDSVQANEKHASCYTPHSQLEDAELQRSHVICSLRSKL